MPDDPRSPVGRLLGPLRDAILASVDPNDIVSRVDVDEVVARIEVQDLLARVDVNDVLDRVDVDRLVQRVDVDALVSRVDIDGIVASSTRGVVGSLVDVVRRQLVGLDAILLRTVQRLRGVDPTTLPDGPPALMGDGEPRGRYDVTGRYAGPLTRLVANAGDVAAAFGLFTLLSAALGYLATILLGVEFSPAEQSGPQWFVPLAVVGLLYTWLSVAVAGRTPAMAVLGIRGVDGRLRLGRPPGQPAHAPG